MTPSNPKTFQLNIMEKLQPHFPKKINFQSIHPENPKISSKYLSNPIRFEF